MRTIFRSANLIDGDSPARARHSVVVEGNSIAEVGPDPAIHPRPTDTVYDLAGKSLMPGMTQGHWHGSYENITFTPKPGGLEKHPSYMAFLALKNAQLALSHGYTSLIGAATGECLDAQLNAAINDGLKSPDVQTQLAKLGTEPRIRSQQDLAKFMAEEAQQWAKMVSSADIKLD